MGTAASEAAGPEEAGSSLDILKGSVMQQKGGPLAEPGSTMLMTQSYGSPQIS